MNEDWDRERTRRLEAAYRFRHELYDAIHRPFMASAYSVDAPPRHVVVPKAEYEAFRAVREIVRRAFDKEIGF